MLCYFVVFLCDTGWFCIYLLAILFAEQCLIVWFTGLYVKRTPHEITENARRHKLGAAPPSLAERAWLYSTTQWEAWHPPIQDSTPPSRKKSTIPLQVFLSTARQVSHLNQCWGTPRALNMTELSSRDLQWFSSHLLQLQSSLQHSKTLIVSWMMMYLVPKHQ